MFAAAADFGLLTVHVQTRDGSNAKGPMYDAEQNVDCYVEYSRKLVRDKTGAQVLSTVTLYTGIEFRGLFPVDSLVRIDEITSTVVQFALHQGIDDDVNHIEVNLA